MTSSVLQSGFILTVAGTGEPDYAGDGGVATAACLNEPKGVALDRAGHLYIVDSENHLIRKVEAETGRISTVAGVPRSGSNGPHAEPQGASSHGAPAEDDPFGEPTEHKPDRYAQVSDVTGTVRFVTGKIAKGQFQFHGDGGPATKAALNFPSAVVVASDGTLYIADTMNHRVRRVDGRTGEISTLAGTGSPRFSGDGGPARAAALNEPNALALDDARGCLYIADQSNNRVRRVDLASAVISTVVGTGRPSTMGTGNPRWKPQWLGPAVLPAGRPARSILPIPSTDESGRWIRPAV